MSAADLIKYIALLDLTLLLIGTGSRLYAFKKLHPAFRLLVVYLLFVSGVEILAKLYVYGWLSGYNLYLLHIYTLVEFVLLALVYQYILYLPPKKNKWLRLYFLIVLISISFYALISLTTSSFSPENFELYSKLFVNGTMIALAIRFFISSLKKPERYLNHFNASAYFNSGALLYFAGSFIIYLIINQMIQAQLSETLYIWLINVLLTFVFHLACVIALWQKDSQRTKTLLYG